MISLVRNTDPIVLFTLATRVIQGLGGPISAALVVGMFSPVEQGYYYTFLGIGAALGFFELGLSTLLTAFAAHAWARIESVHRTSAPEFGYLQSLFRRSLFWYLAMSLVAGLVVGLGGYSLMRAKSDGQNIETWLPAWILFLSLSTLGLAMTPFWAFLSGCGHYERVTRYRFFEVMIRNVTLWCALLSGAGLLACGLSALSVVTASACFLFGRRDFIQSLLFRTASEHAIQVRWRKDVLPMQWRLGVSWICGYLSTVLFVPFSFHVFGPRVAGQVGLTWALAAGLSLLSASWASAKAPQFADLAARCAFGQLDKLVMRTNRTAVFVSMALGGGAFVVFVVATARWPALAERFLPLSAVACFLLADPFMQAATVQSQTLRACRNEAFLPASIAFAMAILVSTPLSVYLSGPTGVAWSYLLGVLAMFIVGRKIFDVHRAQWKLQTVQS